MQEKFKKLPLRSGVGIVVLNKENKVFFQVGVTPDIEIAEGSDDFRINTGTDNQLDYALKLLNG